MNRTLLVAAIVSVLLHAGVAFGGLLFKKAPAAARAKEETPVIELTMPPPPEPEEPEVVENVAADAPADLADLAPPMQADSPSAIIDSPFVQQMQAPPPPVSRPAGSAIVLPTAPPRASAGSGLKNIFNLRDLDKQIEVRVRPLPIYPFEMRRSGLKGEVVVEFIVDTQGDVRDPLVVSSTHPGFEQAALDAVSKWKFKPGQKGGVAVNTRVRQKFPFTLEAN